MKQISDYNLVRGLIDRDEICKQVFDERFRKLVYSRIDEIYKALSVSLPKTDSVREDLFQAFCGHLHSDDDFQFKEYLKEERLPSLESWLEVKLPDFLPDKIVVDGLLHNDKEITSMFVSSTNEYSIRGMINIDRLRKRIKDYDHGGQDMSPQALVTEIFALIMVGEDTIKDKEQGLGNGLRNFQFKGKLKTYIHCLLKALPRYTKYFRGQTGKEKELTLKHDRIQPPTMEIDPEELNVFIKKAFGKMSLSEKGKLDAELLDEYYLKKMKQKDMAVIHGVKENDMNQKIYRARKTFRDVCVQFFGITTYQQIEEYYGKD